MVLHYICSFQNVNAISTIETNLLFIPQDRVISKNAIEALSDEQILQLQQYVDVTFPEFTYRNIDNIVEACLLLGNRIPSDSYVLCPGDSPYKMSYLIEYMFGLDRGYTEYTSSITVNGVSYTQQVSKYMSFMQFPLSDVSSGGIDKKALDNYIWKLDLYSQVANGSKVGIMDYSDSGGTVRIISSSLKRLYGRYLDDVANYDVWKVYEEVVKSKGHIEQQDRSIFFALIAEAERSNCRCQSKYKLGGDKVKYNHYRCNTIIALIYLRFLGRLDPNYEWLPRNSIDVDNEANYLVRYYNTLTLSEDTVEVSGYKIRGEEVLLDNFDLILLNNIYSVTPL